MKTENQRNNASRFVCEICDGNGCVFERDERGRVVVRECSACGAVRANRIRTLRRRANIPLFEPTLRARAEVLAYANAFPRLSRRRAWLLLTGKPGCGKTTNAAILADAVIERYQARARFYNAFDLTRRLVALRRRADDYERALREFVDADLVVLDDFLKSVPSEKSFLYDEFYETTLELIWSRYDARKPFVITTQRNFSAVARFDPALAGRLVESCQDRVVVFDANSQNWRLRERPKERELDFAQ